MNQLNAALKTIRRNQQLHVKKAMQKNDDGICRAALQISIELHQAATQLAAAIDHITQLKAIEDLDFTKTKEEKKGKRTSSLEEKKDDLWLGQKAS